MRSQLYKTDRCVFRRSLDRSTNNGAMHGEMAAEGGLTLELLSRRQSSGLAPEPELVFLSSEPHIPPWGLKEGELNLGILGKNPPYPTVLSHLSLLDCPCSAASSRYHPCSLGWLSSSVLLLSGTLTCPGRHIGSKSASLHHFKLAAMQLDPGRVKPPPQSGHIGFHRVWWLVRT